MLDESDVLAAGIAEKLLAADARLAVVETTAGGLISARLLSVAGASRWFDRAAVAYTGSSKQDMTGVSTDLLKEQGSVNREVVEAMAEGFRERSGAAYCLAESGMAGPQTGRRSAKPAGTSVIALAGPDGTVSREFLFQGSRVQVMEQIAEAALTILADGIRGPTAQA